MGQLALGTALGQALTVQVGHGSSLTARLAAAPVVADGRVYTIDTLGTVRAFDAQTGAQVWASQTPDEQGQRSVALRRRRRLRQRPDLRDQRPRLSSPRSTQRNGGIVWQVRPGGPLRGAPTVADDTVYVMSQDNQIYSLKDADGSTNWSKAAVARDRRRVRRGVARRSGRARSSPASRRASSTPIATRTAARCGRTRCRGPASAPASSSLSDIDADPVIDNGQVFAIGQGGRMVALDLITGQRMWELNIAGIATPWVAGDWVFVVTDDAKLIVHRRARTGKIRWINQLPQFEKPKIEEGRDRLFGPGPGRRPADPRRLERRADQRRSGDRQSSRARPTSARGDQLAAGGRQFDALRARRPGRLHAYR